MPNFFGNPVMHTRILAVIAATESRADAVQAVGYLPDVIQTVFARFSTNCVYPYGWVAGSRW